jgi:hypothetical protein
MKDDPRKQETECRARIYGARDSSTTADLIAMLTSVIERAKVSLLTADAAEVVRLQGKCAGFREVLKWLTEPVNLPVDKV